MRKRKRLVLVMLILSFVIFLLQINMTKANNEQSYETMVEEWQQNSLELKSLEMDLAAALRTYKQTEEDVKVASSSWSELVTLFNMIARDITPEMKFGTVMQRDITLEQAKITYEQTQLSAESSRNQISISLRQAYLNYWRAAIEVESLEKYSNIMDLEFKQQQAEFEQGKISKQSLENSKYAQIELANRLASANRKLNEKRQSLNAVVGMPLDTVYEIGIWEDIIKTDTRQVEIIEKAIEQRLEIKIIEDRIAINDLTIAAYDKFFTYKNMSDSMQENYDDLKEQQYYNPLELNREKKKIEKEIRIAFLDLDYESNKLKTVLNQRNDYSHTLDKIREQFNRGSVPKIELLRAEYDYYQAHNNYLMAIYEHNTLAKQFSYQSGVGLGVNVGGFNNVTGGGRQ